MSTPSSLPWAFKLRFLLLPLLLLVLLVLGSPVSERAGSYVSVPSLDNFILPDIRNVPPMTRSYTLVVQEMLGSPDGVERSMLVVNGSFPGPTIHANQHDRLVITVINGQTNSSTAMHWHGLFQNSTPFWDGVQGATQCGIPPGESLTYNFTLGEFSGTTLYHAHYGLQYSDGVVGPLIINPMPAVTPTPLLPAWDQDIVVMLQDWYHETTDALLPLYLSPEGMDGTAGDEPVPDSAVINGVGRWQSVEKFYNFTLQQNKVYRLRLINSGAMSNIRFSVDDHPLTVVSADSIDVVPFDVSGLEIAVGQRYDVLIHTNRTTGGPWWVRATMLTDMFTYEEPDQSNDQRAVLSYGSSEAGMLGNSSSLDPGPGDPRLSDLNIAQLAPAIRKDAPVSTRQYPVTVTFEDTETGVNLAFMNSTTWSPLSGTATLLLLQSEAAKSNMSSFLPEGPSVLEGNQLILSHDDVQTVDLIVNNLDNGAHPFHMHAHQPWLMASGSGQHSGASTTSLSTDNPMRRDTHLIPGSSWVVLRFVTDNPGIWVFHCHIAWHMAAGLLMQISSQPSRAATFGVPQAILDQCAAN